MSEVHQAAESGGAGALSGLWGGECRTQPEETTMSPDRAALVQEARRRESPCEFMARTVEWCRNTSDPIDAWCSACLLAALVETEPAGTTSLRDTVVEHLDMLQVDRLRTWARNIRESRGDIGAWGSIEFVVAECERIAASIEQVIKNTPALPAPPVTDQETDR